MQFHVGRLIDHVHINVADLERSAKFYEAVLAALRFKCDVLWAQLDALHFAYVDPGLIPPGAFVPEKK